MRGVGPASLALVAAMLLVACGSSSTSGEDLVAEAEAICTDAAGEALNAYVGSFVEEGEEAATIAYVEGLLEARSAELAELEELDPPEGERDAYDEYLEARRAGIDRLASGLDAAEAQDPENFESEQEAAEAARLDADELGAELGFGACANELPAAQVEDVEGVLEETATNSDAERVCEDLATTRFQDQFGGLQSCIAAQEESEQAKGIEVLEVRGVDEVSAVAEVRLIGRDDALNTFTVNLTFVDGTWRVETIVPV